MTSFDKDRRKLLKAGGAGLLAGLAGCIGPFQDGRGVPGTVDYVGLDPDDGFDIDDYLSDAPNYDGELIDRRGEESITIQNGNADTIGVDGTFVYEPAAVQVDPGTDVTWEWVGTDTHTVTHEDETFDSGNVSGEGETFTVEDIPEGLHPYYCRPHRSIGQLGVVVAGELDAGPSMQEYLDDVPNWDGETVEDFTDQEDVTIQNGNAEEIGVEGTFVYDPPVIEVETGTTVTWEWVGTDTHTVTALDDSFDSGNVSGEGETYEVTFDSPGTTLYFCQPHESLGQKGAVIVVDPEEEEEPDDEEADEEETDEEETGEEADEEETDEEETGEESDGTDEEEDEEESDGTNGEDETNGE